jgi:CRP-like cAMP-binding protein
LAGSSCRVGCRSIRARLYRVIGMEDAMPSTSPTLEHLIRSLERRDQLSAEEIALVEALPSRKAVFAARDEIVRENSRPQESCLLLRGLAARVQFLDDGKRQFVAIHVPGDFVDLHSLLLKVMDHSVVALTQVEAAFVPHERLRDITVKAPHLGRLFWLSTVIDAAIERTWITSLGRRDADARIAHLICELQARLEVVGLAREDRFELPLTQSDVADMVGLSLVHVNRTIQDLRGAGLILWQRNLITIKNAEGLRNLAQFDPTYLNLVKEPR